MSDVVIRVDSISKRYTLGEHRREGLRHVFERAARLPRHLLGRVALPPAPREPFWALRDVSFDVRRGEVVGVLGHNGAGKSTLLKILSRITEPSSGRVGLRGRVASLLEIGTGFHPELTGRENIYLNGSILGMTRADITRRFDEIVAFADVERFLDTPIKRYSTGMYVRLAFAVAAHLEPDVLVIDEVLAVGDAQFQKKCLDKMDDVAQRQGRTVLFVSHNMAAVRALCSRALLLSHGRLVMDEAPVDGVVASYLAASRLGDGAEVCWPEADAPGFSGFRFRRAWIESAAGEVSATLANDAPFTIRVEYELTRRLTGLQIGFRLETADGVVVCGATDVGADITGARGPGVLESACRFPGGMLNDGRYHIVFGAHTPDSQSVLTPPCLDFSIHVTADTHSGGHRLPGILRPALGWSVASVE